MGLFGKKSSKKNLGSTSAASGDYSMPDDTAVGSVDVVETSQTSQVVTTAPSNSSEDSKKKALLADEETGSEDGLNKPSDDKPLKEKLMEHLTVMWAAILGCCGLPKVLAVSLAAGAGIGAVTYLLATRGQAPMFPARVNVAFVGNSYFYVNDLPRFVENIAAGGKVYQDSCLHNSAGILEIIMTGNGMWNKWATKNAMIGGVKFEASNGNTEYLYDMGACSVPQLLTGHDKLVTSGDQLGSFIDDGENPCFQEDAYLEYQESFDYKGWDFVVITDQAKRMCFDDTRHEALAAFNYTYGPILKKKKISPIIVQPHAYQSSGANATGLSDLPTFTALIMEGALIYKKYLNQRIGLFQGAHIAPVGNAFLAVYEADKSMYKKLFLDDGVHPSGYGTFLYGTVIYATMMGYMPRYKDVVVDNMEDTLFGTARKLQASSSSAGFPSKEEAAILFRIAKKVALNGYKPKSLRGFKPETNAAEFIQEEVSSSSYEGDYSVEVYSGYQNYNPYYQDGGNNGYNDYYVDYSNGNNGGNGNGYNNGYNAAANYQAANNYGGYQQAAYGGNGYNNGNNNGNRQ
ncbi:hypothetical protein IV203_015266 [Nitzschia inconspicua]|uniref:Uncharacterized protein n=1 Tax=Nitzschia inconspicua TaxID=303405 RepID=A0A9K3PT41_9STRA|nr:hypothetical protein IV203_020220 [Nitzschia inconspicua]KAG7358677.1 hypothetical protein IV203_015266 [Nitzschia inconspicua]